MWQMEHAGWFRYVKGFYIGRPLQGEEMFGLDKYRAVLYTAEKHGVPVFMDVDLGHLSPTMPLITGSYAKIEAEEKKVTVTMELR